MSLWAGAGAGAARRMARHCPRGERSGLRVRRLDEVAGVGYCYFVILRITKY